MSGLSTQGVGAGVSANADVVSAASAAATKKVLVENLVIIRTPGNRPSKPRQWRFLEQTTNAIRPSIHLQYACDFVISRGRRRNYVGVPV